MSDPDTAAAFTPGFRPNAGELVANNERYVQGFADHDLSLRPRRQLAIVACMDSRMDIFQMLGLEHGEAHIIRNAGGVVTDDVIRSLVLSQRLLGTREIVLVHHTNCGLQAISEDEFKAEIEAEVGIKPWWALECFTDPFADVRQSINRLRNSPFVKYKEHISGFVYDDADGRLHTV
jgi:carbonic anhydrase